MKDLLAVAVALTLTAAIVTISEFVVGAQPPPVVARLAEAPPRTLTWEAAHVTYRDGSYTRVDVIELSGVCLYIAIHDLAAGPALVAVPKSQLQKGSGCQ